MDTYWYGCAADLAGLLIIGASAVLAAVASLHKLMHPQPIKSVAGWICLWPVVKSVATVEKMMTDMTRFEKNMPRTTSQPTERDAVFIAPWRCLSFVRPMLISSSSD